MDGRPRVIEENVSYLFEVAQRDVADELIVNAGEFLEGEIMFVLLPITFPQLGLFVVKEAVGQGAPSPRQPGIADAFSRPTLKFRRQACQPISGGLPDFCIRRWSRA